MCVCTAVFSDWLYNLFFYFGPNQKIIISFPFLIFPPNRSLLFTRRSGVGARMMGISAGIWWLCGTKRRTNSNIPKRVPKSHSFSWGAKDSDLMSRFFHFVPFFVPFLCSVCLIRFFDRKFLFRQEWLSLILLIQTLGFLLFSFFLLFLSLILISQFRLLHCCVVGDVSTARWLIKEKEANPNLVLKEGSGYLEANQLFYQIGDTPLTIAERFGHIPLCDYLRKSSLKSQKKSRSRSLAASPLEVTSSKTTPSSSSSSSSTVTDATTRTLVFPSSDFYSSDEEEEEEDSRKDDEGSWEMVSIMLEPRKGLGLPPRRTSTPVPNSADILTCGSPLPSSPLTSSPILTSLTSSPVTPREFRSPHSDSIPSSPLSSREFKHNTDIIIPASLTPRARNHLSPPDFRHHGSELVLPNPNRAPPLQETKHQKSFTEKILAKKKKSSTISHPNLKRRVEVFGEGEERKRTGTASLGRANSGEGLQIFFFLFFFFCSF